MKRTISILTVCLLVLTLLAGCGSSTVVVQQAPAEGTDLAATVTISIGGFQNLIAEAAK